MVSLIYQNPNSKIVVKLWNTEYCLLIYETKELIYETKTNLFFSNQTRFDLKSINGI